MNRLIIIGNGFDIAHGLKTRYTDFIDYWLAETFGSISNYDLGEDADSSFSSLEVLEDPFCTIKLYHLGGYQIPGHLYLEAFKLFVEFRMTEGSSVRGEKIRAFIDRRSSLTAEIDHPLRIGLEISFNSLLAKFISEDSVNWSNIESAYYEELKKSVQKTKNLNKQLQTFQNRFVKYLKTLDTKRERLPFLEVLKQKSLFTQTLNRVVILSFNYTDLIDLYVSELRKVNQNTSLIKIHGDIHEEESNPIILGYGDEHDKGYKLIEESENPGALEFIKSMKYFLSDNYKNLIKFAQSRQLYEVFVIGHSCGLTDKTLLHYLFEETKLCRSIYPFYHEKKEIYFDNVKAISRHFEDKVALREKVVNLNKENLEYLKLPEIKNEKIKTN